MTTVTSKDGTIIAFDKSGQGPPLIMVNGALGYREFYGGGPLAAELSQEFTFYDYDRRGRGESTDTQPYAVEREIEDIEALIDDAGGKAFLYGISSGAALALEAAAKLGPGKIVKLALYEPPYGASDAESKRGFAQEKKKMSELAVAGKRSDAVALFISGFGVSPDAIEEMKQTPDWKHMADVGQTLAYDYAVLGDGAVPAETAKAVSMPTLIMDGDKSFEFMRAAADLLGEAITNAQRKTLPDQTHEVSPEVLAPVLTEFFNA